MPAAAPNTRSSTFQCTLPSSTPTPTLTHAEAQSSCWDKIPKKLCCWLTKIQIKVISVLCEATITIKTSISLSLRLNRVAIYLLDILKGKEVRPAIMPRYQVYTRPDLRNRDRYLRKTTQNKEKLGEDTQRGLFWLLTCSLTLRVIKSLRNFQGAVCSLQELEG